MNLFDIERNYHFHDIVGLELFPNYQKRMTHRTYAT